MKKRETGRRILALILVFVMVFTAWPMMAFAAEPMKEAMGTEENDKFSEFPDKAEESIKDGQNISKQLTFNESETMDLTITVILKTSMKVIINNSGPFEFEVNGKSYSFTSTDEFTSTGPISFDVTFNDVPISADEDVDVRLVSLANSVDEQFSVVGQDYNEENQTLTVSLGRDLYFNVSDIKDGVNYDGFMLKHNVPGFELTLYDVNGNILKTSTAIDNIVGPVLLGVQPGTYKLKISKAPTGYKDYDISYVHTLTVADNGYPRLEIYQKDGKYNVVRPLGAWESTYPTDPMLLGTKSPLLLLVAKQSPVNKVIMTGDGSESEKLEVGKGDVVEFKIKKTIFPDHNTVIYKEKDVNIGTYVNQSFEDVLDENLEYQKDSLSLNLDGKETNDFKAFYDAENHRIVVEDQSLVDVQEIDFSFMTDKRIQLPQPKELIVSFKVKVKKAEDTIQNTVDGSSVELTPFTIPGRKVWDDGDQSGARPESIRITLLANDKVVKTIEVNATDQWKWEFKDLPKYKGGKEIQYTIAEEKIPGYTTEITGSMEEGFTVTNKPDKPIGGGDVTEISINVKKVWEDDNDKENKRPGSVIVHLLADGEDTGKTLVLSKDNGWQGSFDDLLKYDGEHKIVYTIKEEPIEDYETSIAGDMTAGFTVTNRRTPPDTPETPPEPPIPSIPPIPSKPSVPSIPIIPQAGAGR